MVKMQNNRRPSFSLDEVKIILNEHYGLQAGTIRELTAELDRNFYICDDAGTEYILKIAHQSLTSGSLDLQNKALQHLSASMTICPQLRRSSQNTLMIQVKDAEGKFYDVRLLNYLPGIPLVDFRPHSRDLIQDIGQQSGCLTRALQSFDHPEKRLDYRWNIRNMLALVAFADDMPDDRRSIILRIAERYQKTVLPYLDRLRHSFIYNDANDHNILVQLEGMTGRVSGFIDFGDMVYAPTIAELAVMLAYIMMDKKHPLDVASTLIQAYHSEFPLTEGVVE